MLRKIDNISKINSKKARLTPGIKIKIGRISEYLKVAEHIQGELQERGMEKKAILILQAIPILFPEEPSGVPNLRPLATHIPVNFSQLLQDYNPTTNPNL